MSPTKTKKKAAEVEEVEDFDDEDVELDELDDDADEAPAKGKRGGAQAEVTFGVADLVKYLAKETGKTYSTRDLRTLIRKMARDGSGRVDRVITAGNRTRYDWPLGLKDPEVKAIVKAVKGGEVEAGRKEALDSLKARKAKKDEAKGKAGKKSKKAAPVDEDDDDDEDEDDDE